MRKIFFVFTILFIFAFPAFAGENVERQAQKQIIVASGDETCKQSVILIRTFVNRIVLATTYKPEVVVNWG